jgi:hypothetical protein
LSLPDNASTDQAEEVEARRVLADDERRYSYDSNDGNTDNGRDVGQNSLLSGKIA